MIVHKIKDHSSVFGHVFYDFCGREERGYHFAFQIDNFLRQLRARSNEDILHIEFFSKCVCVCVCAHEKRLLFFNSL